MATEGVLRECNTILQNLHPEEFDPKIPDNTQKIEYLMSMRRKATKLFTSKQWYLAIRPSFFKRHISEIPGRVLDCYIGTVAIGTNGVNLKYLTAQDEHEDRDTSDDEPQIEKDAAKNVANDQDRYVDESEE